MREKPALNDRDYATTIASAVFGEPVDENDIYAPGVLNALSTLSEREEKVLDMRLRQQKTFKEVGICLGVGQERVRQIVHRGLRALRHPSRSRRMRISCILDELGRTEQALRECRAELGKYKRKMEQFYEMLQTSEDYPPCGYVDDNSLLIEEIPLPLRAYNCLKRAGVNSAHKIATLNASELLRIRNLGKTSTLHIIDAMKDAGYAEWAQTTLAEMG